MAVMFTALHRSGLRVACFGPLADHVVIAGDEAATVALRVLVGVVDPLRVLDRLALDDLLLCFLVSHLYLLGSPAGDAGLPCSRGWYSSHFLCQRVVAGHGTFRQFPPPPPPPPGPPRAGCPGPPPSPGLGLTPSRRGPLGGGFGPARGQPHP